jgi:hypothetical protein
MNRLSGLFLILVSIVLFAWWFLQHTGVSK